MSLTYPVLNDIIAEKVNRLSDEIKEVYGNFNIQIQEYNKSKSNMQELVCKQDVKIDLIHALFKHYKDSMNYELNDEDNRIYNLSQFKEEYNNILFKLNKTINKTVDENNKKVLARVNNKYNEIKINLNNYIEKINKIDTNKLDKKLTDIIFKLDCLEKKYLELENKINKSNLNNSSLTNSSLNSNIYSMDNYSDSDSDSDNTNNWIQVSRKYRSKK
tara:strand:- start:1196 stop:1846 length:651 start_codon:yes stop_codon:yes gene_type:complete